MKKDDFPCCKPMKIGKINLSGWVLIKNDNFAVLR